MTLTQVFQIEDFSGSVIATDQSAQAALSAMPRDGYCIDQFSQWFDRDQMREIVAAETNYRPHVVVDMDGHEIASFDSRDAAEAWAEERRLSFCQSRPDGDRSYLPMSVIPAGPRRRAYQYSTKWVPA